MKKLQLVLMALGYVVSCQDYVTNKRDGLKRFPAEETREAQEE